MTKYYKVKTNTTHDLYYCIIDDAEVAQRYMSHTNTWKGWLLASDVKKYYKEISEKTFIKEVVKQGDDPYRTKRVKYLILKYIGRPQIEI